MLIPTPMLRWFGVPGSLPFFLLPSAAPRMRRLHMAAYTHEVGGSGTLLGFRV